VDKLLQAANTYAPVARVPSAHRLTPLAPARNSGSSPTPTGSDTSVSTATAKKHSDIDPDEADIDNLTGEELLRVTATLLKQKQALQRQVEAISGSGKPGSGAGMQQSASGPAVAEQPARKSGVTFGTHRNSVLVVDFSKPDHQQRPSMIARTEQLK
jgi:hypothetical protein